jgi:hypothetical protein
MAGLDDSEDADAAQALALADEHDRQDVPGLEGIDVDKVSQDVAAVGQPPGAMPVGPVVPQAPPAITETPAAPPPAAAPAVPEEKPPSDTEEKEAAATVGAPPSRPKYTGDPTKDVQLNLDWSRQLTDYQTALDRKAGEIAARDADVTAKRAEREAQAEREAATARQAQQEAYQAERAQRQQAIDSAVAEKASALADAKDGGKRSFGEAIADAVAIALGGYGQGLMLAGHVAGARNEGLESVNRLIAADDARRRERLKNATDVTLEARYGFKDAEANHRAALADIDADRAAKYRLIAAEAAQQIRQRGGDDQAVKTNQVVVSALQEAAKSEDAIHAREEATQVHRETAASTNKLAEAHLNLAERQAKATESQRREMNYEHRREFDLREEDRRDAKSDKRSAAEKKAADDLDKRTLRDPDTGEEIVVLSRPGAVDKAADKLTASRAYSRGLRELADDAEKNERVAPALPFIGNVTEASKRRDELYGNVIARGRKALELGVSNNNLQIEHQNVGGSGKGLSSMPSPEVLRKMADDNDAVANERLRASGKALPGAVPAAEKTGGAPLGGRSPHQDVLDMADKADRAGKAPEMVTIRNAKTGQTKRVSREEAKRLGAL